MFNQELGKLLDQSIQRHNKLITQLYHFCDIDEDDVVRFDSVKLSDFLEEVFRKHGLIVEKEEE